MAPEQKKCKNGPATDLYHLYQVLVLHLGDKLNKFETDQVDLLCGTTATKSMPESISDMMALLVVYILVALGLMLLLYYSCSFSHDHHGNIADS